MKKEHLPIFGVGPIIILPQIIITIIGVILTEKGIVRLEFWNIKNTTINTWSS